MVGTPKVVQVVPPTPRNVELTVFWQRLGQRIARYLGEHAHVNVVVILKDGKVQQVRFDESVLPPNV